MWPEGQSKLSDPDLHFSKKDVLFVKSKTKRKKSSDRQALGMWAPFQCQGCIWCHFSKFEAFILLTCTNSETRISESQQRFHHILSAWPHTNYILLQCSDVSISLGRTTSWFNIYIPYNGITTISHLLLLNVLEYYWPFSLCCTLYRHDIPFF